MKKTTVKKIKVHYANVRGFSAKKCSIEKILNDREIDFAFFSEVNNKHPGRIPGCSKFEKPSTRKFHGVVLYASQRWNGLLKRVLSRDEDKNLEWIHLS